MRALALLAMLAVIALFVAGCGSSDQSNAPAATPQAPPSGSAPQIDQQAFDKLRSCLKKQGVTLPSGGPQGQPGQGQPPTVDSKAQNAMRVCSQYLPAQPPGGFGG